MLSRTTKAFLTSSMLFALSAPTLAQDTSDEASSQGIVRFMFDGGTASHLVDELETTFPDFSVVLDEKAGQFILPQFEARVTDAGTIVELITKMPGMINPANQDDGIVKEGQLDFQVVGRELVYITFDETQDTRSARAVIQVAVLSIQELLTSGMELEEIMSTIEAGIELRMPGKQPTIRFHPTTGIIFIKSDKATLDVVSMTIEALKKSAAWRISDEALAAKAAVLKSKQIEILEELQDITSEQQMKQLKEVQRRAEERAQERTAREEARDEKERQKRESQNSDDSEG